MAGEDKIREVLDPAPQKGDGLFQSILGDYAISKSLKSKISIVAMLIAFYSGVKYHEPAQRMKDYLLNHNIQVEQGYFQDPRGLDIQIRTNDHGRREVYLRHEESQSYRAIKRDLLPRTDTLLDGLEQRIQDMSPEKKDHIYDRLDAMRRDY